MENGTVIVGDGTVLDRASVVIAGERSVAVAGAAVDAPGAARIDASGKTILPGMMDTHVHLLVADLQSQPRSDAELEAFLEDGLPARLDAFLDAGITTVMSTGDFWPWIGEVRDGLEYGGLRGPRLFTSGPVFTAPGGHPAAGPVCGPWMGRDGNLRCTEHMAAVVRTPEEVGAAVHRLATEGIDHVKMVFDTTAPPQVELLDPELVGEIVPSAHAEGLRAYAHISEIDKALAAVDAGVDGLVHVPYATSDPEAP